MHAIEGKPTIDDQARPRGGFLGPQAVLEDPRFGQWNRWIPPTLARHGMRTPTLVVLGMTLTGVVMLAGACVLLTLAWLAPRWVPDFVPDPGAPWGTRTSILVCAGVALASLVLVAALVLYGMARTSRTLAPDAVEGLRREPVQVLGTHLDELGDPGEDGGLAKLRAELLLLDGSRREVPCQGVPANSFGAGSLGVAYLHHGVLLAFQRMERPSESMEPPSSSGLDPGAQPRTGHNLESAGVALLLPLLSGLVLAGEASHTVRQDAEPEIRLDPTLVHEQFLDPKERDELRERLEVDHHRIATRGLAEGWKAKEKKGFVYLNQADRKGLAHVQEHVEASWEWIEDVLPALDPGVRVRKPVVRIFATAAEQSADGEGQPPYPHRRPEVWLNRRGLGSTSVLVRQVVEAHLREQDRRLKVVLPNWFDQGLGDLCQRAYLSKGKLAFVLADVDQAAVRDQASRGRLIPTAILLQWGATEEYEAWAEQHPEVKDQHATTQSKLLMTYLLAGRGTKHRDHKRILPELMSAYSQALAERREAQATAFDPATAPWPSDEAQEQEWIVDELTELSTERKRLQADTYFRVFRDWSEQDWKKLERAYLPDLR